MGRLVLSRKSGEQIVVGDDPILENNTVITIGQINGDRVRVITEAPKDIPINRREIYDAIKRDESKANQGSFYFDRGEDYINLRINQGEIISR